MSTYKSNNLAARMGRWSANHWKTATFGWLAFVLVAFALGGMAGTKSVDQNEPGPGESGRMEKILDEGFKQPVGESVLIENTSVAVDDAAFTAVIQDVVRRLETLGEVQNVQSPLDPENAEKIAAAGHAVLVEFEIRGDPDDAVDNIGPILDRVDVAQQIHPAYFIGEFGNASAEDAVVTAYGDDLGKAGELSLPITLLILVIAFGSLIAAGIPLLLALTAVFGTFGLIALSSHIVPMANEASALVLLIGLAVGVDYSMFYLKRAREERAAGRSVHAAVEAAAATSGRSVLVSGLTVMTAMAGMFLTGDKIFASLAIATITVVAMAVLGSLTVLPALLCRLGDKVDRLRVPFIGRRRGNGQGRFWARIVDRVMRRPVLWAADRWPGFVPPVTARDTDLQPHAGGFPGHGPAGECRGRGARRQRTPGAGGDPGAPRACPRHGPRARAVHRRREQGRDSGQHHHPDRRQGHRRGLRGISCRVA
jgi:uncharacterized membrane protein YdfJ with MMPL/SSD domain